MPVPGPSRKSQGKEVKRKQNWEWKICISRFLECKVSVKTPESRASSLGTAASLST
jgi:hypothetical protein